MNVHIRPKIKLTLLSHYKSQEYNNQVEIKFNFNEKYINSKKILKTINKKKDLAYSLRGAILKKSALANLSLRENKLNKIYKQLKYQKNNSYVTINRKYITSTYFIKTKYKYFIKTLLTLSKFKIIINTNLWCNPDYNTNIYYLKKDLFLKYYNYLDNKFIKIFYNQSKYTTKSSYLNVIYTNVMNNYDYNVYYIDIFHYLNYPKINKKEVTCEKYCEKYMDLTKNVKNKKIKCKIIVKNFIIVFILL